MTASVVIRSVRILGAEPCDLLVEDGRIARIGIGLTAAAAIDGGGRMALPALVEAHTHLGYSLLGLPWYRNAVGPRLIDKIETERSEIRRLGVDPELQATRLLQRAASLGSLYLRGHVAVDTDFGLGTIEAVLRARAACRDLIDVQIVAFPQSGVLIRPGTAELMDRAMALGADLVGGIDPSTLERDPKGHLDLVFALSQKHGKGIDIHLHEPAELGAFSLELIIERTRALGLAGRVMVSHAFCLGMADQAYVARLTEDLAEAGIAIMTTGPAGPCPPVKALMAAGVTVCTGSDGVRDVWGPYANADILERAMLVGMRNNFRRDDDIALAFRTATDGGAAALGLDAYGIREGARADLVLVQAETLAEAVVARPQPRTVIRQGRVVAEAGKPAA